MQVLVFKIFVIFAALTLCPIFTNGAKILSIFGYPGPSQYMIASALLKGLAERGHEVTSISTFPQKTPVKNFRDIIITENAKLYEPLLEESITLKKEKTSFFHELIEFIDYGVRMVTNVLENSEVKDIMKNEKFDLVIVEALQCEALYGFGQHFNAPLIGVSTFGTVNFVDILVNNISPMSYIPDISLPYSNYMSLKERIVNVVSSILEDVLYNLLMLPPQKKLFHNYFPSSKLTFDEARKSFSLVLLNQHFTLSFPRPYVPNMIEVGGLHIKQKPDPLPQDLQQLLDNATEGAIYFSMGSNLQSKDLPVEILNIFVDTFRELKLKVLWKFEAKTLANKPGNVFIKEWYPQASVLAHPNVKLFISHGGFLSTTETIFHAKPILGIPVFVDQPMNVKNAVNAGYALSLTLDNITRESFKSSIMELLANESYTTKVQQLSKRFRDQPLTPLATAIYWIEYVLRHDGADHLRNAGVRLNYWQQYNIDVFVVLFGVLVLIIVFLVAMKRLLFKLVCTIKTSKKTTAKAKVKRN